MKLRLSAMMVLFVIFIALVSSVTCAPQAQPVAPKPSVTPTPAPAPIPTPAPSPKPEWKWPDSLFVGTMAVGSNNYATALAWTTPLSKEIGIPIRLVSTDKINVMTASVVQGETFTCTMGGTSSDLLEGAITYATRDLGPQNIAFFAVSSKTDSGFAVRGDSKIKTPYDITPGTKIVYYTFMPKSVYEAILAWGNKVKPDQVEWVPAASIPAAVRSMIDGRGEIMFAYPTTPTNMELENAPCGMNWIELDPVKDPEGRKRFDSVMPNFTYGTMTTGVKSAIGKKAFVTVNGYVVNQNLDPNLTYNVLKWMDKNYDKFKDGSPDTSGITVDNLMMLAETGFIPIHEGSVRYLKEIGKWTAKHEARNQQNIEMIKKYVTAYQAAIKLADSRGVPVDPGNAVWIQLWEQHKKEQGLAKFSVFSGLN